MLLTPDEARTQECPMMTYCANESSVIQEGRAAINYQRKCAGPECKIGWRWAAVGDQRGYCGFAGKPE